MSHDAMKWAMRQTGLKPTTKLVLVQLADHHNPRHGCFPSQSLLASKCGMSRSALNEHLATLERSGFWSGRAPDERTKRQRPTRYLLALGRDIASTKVAEISPSLGRGARAKAESVSEIETRAVSGKQGRPCPENEESRVRNSDSNLVREPLSEPVTAEADRFEEFWETYPHRAGYRKGRKPSEKKFHELVRSGIDPRDLVDAAAALFGQLEIKRGFARDPLNWLRQEGWLDECDTDQATSAALDALTARYGKRRTLG